MQRYEKDPVLQVINPFPRARIREAASRMRKFSSCRKNLMFVITDGAPNERYDRLRDTVKELER